MVGIKRPRDRERFRKLVIATLRAMADKLEAKGALEDVTYLFDDGNEFTAYGTAEDCEDALQELLDYARDRGGMSPDNNDMSWGVYVPVRVAEAFNIREDPEAIEDPVCDWVVRDAR